jgi:hypothetical protein
MIGPFMEGLYGGRSEVRVRHELRETMQADFRSQYSTINALMGLQELMIAERVEAIEGGPAGVLCVVGVKDRPHWQNIAGGLYQPALSMAFTGCVA